jgi:hypothetical protein
MLFADSEIVVFVFENCSIGIDKHMIDWIVDVRTVVVRSSVCLGGSRHYSGWTIQNHILPLLSWQNHFIIELRALAVILYVTYIWGEETP